MSGSSTKAIQFILLHQRHTNLLAIVSIGLDLNNLQIMKERECVYNGFSINTNFIQQITKFLFNIHLLSASTRINLCTIKQLDETNGMIGPVDIAM